MNAYFVKGPFINRGYRLTRLKEGGLAEGSRLSQGDLGAYDYSLPKERIAQHPLEPRSSARLLDARHGPKAIVNRLVSDLPDVLLPGDVVVVNESKVIPARLRLRRKSGGSCEVLLIEGDGEGNFKALIRPSKRIKGGEVLVVDESPVLEVRSEDSSGLRLVRIVDAELAKRLGEIPLPPYIEAELSDPERYQTVFAAREGSVAAPTAGLHFDQATISAIEAKGIEIVKIDLAVGLGTFLPIKSENLSDHKMHEEAYDIPVESWLKITQAKRVLAVGTTVLRALESAKLTGELSGRTDLFVREGFRFQVVDVLMTNFHVPRSTLVVLISAFYGPAWREVYEYALQNGYRFLSFGDAMLLSKGTGR